MLDNFEYSEKCYPYIINCENDIKELAYKKAYNLYGNPLPTNIQERLDKELNAIIKNNYATIYMLNQKIAQKANEKGYITGNRGSVSSSLVAYLLGITEINPLKPHYRCPKCKYVEFVEHIENGFDLSNKNCPNCNHKLIKDGMNIPFETFAGIDRDREPDIDLKVANDFYEKAEDYINEILENVTIYKVIKDFNGEIKQYPSKFIILPNGKSIYDFCPKEKVTGLNITATFLECEPIYMSLLNVDIEKSDELTRLQKLKELTNVDLSTIPLDDKETMEMICLADKADIAEFGTEIARDIILKTKPTTFNELVKINGLINGTDTWTNNAEELIRNEIATLNDVISCRDDIMNYLIEVGIESKLAFEIMETIRKGRVARKKEAKWTEYAELMRKHNVPEWYIKSCEKIQYLLPKCHIVSNTLNAYREMWFKVHYPIEFNEVCKKENGV